MLIFPHEKAEKSPQNQHVLSFNPVVSLNAKAPGRSARGFPSAGADDGNRTRVICLEGRGSTIELHPRTPGGDTKILTGIVHVRDIYSPLPYDGASDSSPRGVAQLGSASALGAEGRRFKSCHPDQPRPRSRGFFVRPRECHAVLSHHYDGDHPGTRAGPRRSRGRRPVRHVARVLGYFHRLRSASRHRPIHRRGGRRSERDSPQHPRRRAPRRRCATRPAGRCRGRALTLPCPLSERECAGGPGLVRGVDTGASVWC